MPTCNHCSQQFEITTEDLNFYEKVSPIFNGTKCLIPPPKLCPLCRQQRRQARRNERKLYNRKCDASGKQVISIYSSDSPYKAYDSKIWWGDSFDGKKYGRDFDFTKSFFEQFYQLQLEVPRPALFGKTTENSDYTNHTDQVKNCYLVMNSGLTENSIYGNWVVYAKDCVDCSYIEHCELCYETRYALHCYNCKFVTHSENCHDSSFLYDCKSVSNSLMCVGLRNKEYCILNEPYTKDDYQQKLDSFKLDSFSGLEQAKKIFNDFLLTCPHRAAYIVNSEDCLGENIVNSKNAQNCFYVHNSQDAKHCYNCLGIKDSYDAYEAGFECELQIDTHACNRGKSLGFCSVSFDNNTIWYCDLCHNSQNLFGCISLKGDQYCILNKQYTKKEYEELLPRIIEHMKARGEFGEFFPIALSPFAYNETLANDTFPLSKEVVEKNGWRWHEDKLGSAYQGEVVKIPETAAEMTDSFIEKILTCDNCQKHYRLIKQELSFYRERAIPIPHFCIECRHRTRTQESTRITLHNRTCMKCTKDIQTTYPPDAPEIIYCESCYLAHTY